MITDAHISISIVFITIIAYYWFILLTKRYNNKITTIIIIFARVIYETGWPKYSFALIPQTNNLYENPCWKMLQHFTGQPIFSSIHFPICNIRMEQTWKENTAIYNYASFRNS